jgi:hypothetical protein
MRFGFVPAFLTYLTSASGAIVVIDSFTAGNGVYTNFGYQNGVSYGLTTPADYGDRQPWVDAVSAVDNFDYARIAFENGTMTFTSQNARGQVGLIYQGAPINLEQNFVQNDAVQIKFGSPLSTNLSLIFQFGSSNSAKSIIARTIPLGSSAYTISLNDFQAQGVELFDPSDVTFIYPTFTTSQAGKTFSIDSITIIPEPGSGGLVLGAFTMIALRRIRRGAISSCAPVATGISAGS